MRGLMKGITPMIASGSLELCLKYDRPRRKTHVAAAPATDKTMIDGILQKDAGQGEYLTIR